MFGPATRRLFGLYHPAEEGRPVRGTVLICPPFGQEALRSHRFFKVLADRLARAGHSVLRFDYYGTGDSPGDDAEGDLEGWSHDVVAAHEELRRLSTTPAGTPPLSWLGARLGGTLALLAARRARPSLDRLVLWEPVMDGAAYAQMLREWHVHSLEISYCIPEPSLRRQLANDENTFVTEASGFGVSARLRAQVLRLRPEELRCDTTGRTTVIARPGDRAVAQWARLQQAARVLDFEHPLDWNSDPGSSNALVPAEALKQLLATMNE
jgi:pimeloyl-ACP methyl ester carboxylesterase